MSSFLNELVEIFDKFDVLFLDIPTTVPFGRSFRPFDVVRSDRKDRVNPDNCADCSLRRVITGFLEVFGIIGDIPNLVTDFDFAVFCLFFETSLAVVGTICYFPDIGSSAFLSGFCSILPGFMK